MYKRQVVYYSWEIQLIDSPVFQRLRDIQQLGRAEMTYPSAHHSRFEHSLGTTAIASKMIDNLSQRSSDYNITDKDKYKIRLAALLHDRGHCFYSHFSESVYSALPAFAVIREYMDKKLNKEAFPKPHEIFSYLIITSESFVDFFYKYILYPDKGSIQDVYKRQL